jgi:hypothetical protein
MRSTFKVLFYLKRDKQKANGNIPLFCRITVDGKEARFGMKRDIHPKFWDVKVGKATGRTSEAGEINTLLDNTKSAIYKVYRDLQERENNVCAEKIKNVFLGIETKHQNLLEIFDEHNSEKELLSQKKIISESTYDKYRITRDHLAQFMKECYSRTDIALKEINHKFICDFEVFLRTSRGCAEKWRQGIFNAGGNRNYHEAAIFNQTFGKGAGRFHFLLFYGNVVYRREKSSERPNTDFF